MRDRRYRTKITAAGRVLAAAALLLIAIGCSIELPGSGAPPRMYVLTPKSTFDESMPSVDWQLLIEVPNSPAGINTARIALSDSPIEMRYFAHANWTDQAPKMVQTLLVESFENSNRIVSVGREAIGLRADYILKTELREFQAEYPQPLPREADETVATDIPPIIRVRINAKLIQLPRRSIVASVNFESTVTAESNSMLAIINAFDDALGKTMKRLVVWTLKNGKEYYEPPPGIPGRTPNRP
jgi:cholesterol transport system auxiliary component